jgi:hypothetical protein
MYIDDLLKFTLYWAVLLICLQFDNATAFHIHPVNLVNSQQVRTTELVISVGTFMD